VNFTLGEKFLRKPDSMCLISMKIIIRSLLALCIVLLPVHAFAEARAPQLVIRGFIEAIQKNDTKYLEKYVDLEKIKKQKRHSYTIKSLKSLFANVAVVKIEFSKPVYDKKTKIIRVRMKSPLSFDFELQHQNTLQPAKGDFYRIIGLHP